MAGPLTRLSLLMVVVAGLLTACTTPRQSPGGVGTPAGTASPASPVPASTATIEPGAHRLTIEYGGDQREAIVHVPAGRSGLMSALIAMHGLGGHGADVEMTGLTTAGQEHGMVMVYPDGREQSWNAGACCGQAAQSGLDDVGYLAALIDALVADYGVDPARVSLAGFSNGGMMAHRFACERPDRVASISVVAGALAMPDCAPGEPVSVLVLHSRADGVVPAAGGLSGGPGGEWVWPGVEADAARWATLNRCAAPVEQTSQAGLLSRDWLECAQGTQVRLRLSSDGGHEWPMGGTAQLDATAEVVEFATAASRG